MHDPQTLAFEIKYPWFHYKPWPKKARKDPNPLERKFRYKQLSEQEKSGTCSHWPEGYRETFISIWHVDPERDGSDDSCGWCFPKLTKKQIEILRNAAWHEGSNRHFLRCGAKTWDGTLADVESLYRGMVFLVARVLNIKMTADEIALYAIEATHLHDIGKAGSVFCFLPGYHTNFQKDDDDHRRDHFHGILCGVARNLLREKRPWWKHPRWHFWHWKFQVHPLQTFKRWAFSRCCKCGHGFKWGEVVVTHQWDSPGPKWFRGEKHVMHDNCCGAASPAESSTRPEEAHA